MRRILPFLILAACAGIAYYLVHARAEPERRSPPESALQVEAARLAPQTYEVTVRSRGTVRPLTETVLIPEVSGMVTEVSPSLREGGFFEKDDLLLKIEPLNYETMRAVAAGQVATAEAALAQELARAGQALENWERLGKTGEPGLLVRRDPQRAEAEALLAAAKAEPAKAERDLERTEIRAPYNGRALERHVDVGQFVGTGTELARIFAIDEVEVRLPLTNDQLAFVDLREPAPGEAVIPDGPVVTLRGEIGGRETVWQGRLVRVSGAIDETSRQLFVIAQVDDPYEPRADGTPPLKIGLYVEAEIAGKTLTDVFVLPRSSVRAGNEVLTIDEDNRLHRISVVPLVSTATEVVVPSSGPLADTHLLCLTPLAFPAENAPVVPQIVPPGNASPAS
ncbi:hypothetical protein BH23VER1_BH23VER1_03130 [soil metagenome]